jgi:DNA-directed RNA polymerase specialized sigma24 family protein
MCKNAHDADDVLQDTLLAVRDSPPRFRRAVVASQLGVHVDAGLRATTARGEEPAHDGAAETLAGTDPEQAAASRELAVALPSGRHVDVERD